MKPKEHRRPASRTAVVQGTVSGIFGAACGFVMVSRLPDLGVGPLPSLAILLGLLGLGLWLQTVLHELGHLLFGLLSGYRFLSFRVGRVLLLREKGKLRLRRYSLAGTSGQCLMLPPEGDPETIPVRLYNLGGVMMNVLWGALGVLGAAISPQPVVQSGLSLFAASGFLMALLNGIPLRGTVDNDGYNLRAALACGAPRRALWVQLQVAGAMAQGLRLREMPEEWFRWPEETDLSNSLCAAAAVYCCNRLLDEHRLAECRERITALLDGAPGLTPLYRGLLAGDRMFLELLRGDIAAVQALDTQETRRILHVMRGNPSVLRTGYARACLERRDQAEAAKLLVRFDRIAARWPYAGDIASERELLALVSQ